MAPMTSACKDFVRFVCLWGKARYFRRVSSVKDNQLEGLRAATGFKGHEVDAVGQRDTLVVVQDHLQYRRVPGH